MGDEHGFTFVEVMVSLTILAFVVTIVSLLYVKASSSYARDSKMIEVQENLMISLNKMSQNIRQASDVSVCDAAGNPVVANPASGPWIKFTVATPPGSGRNTGYKLGNGTVAEDVGEGVYLPIACDIKDLRFCYDKSLRLVTITVTGGKKGIRDVTLSTTVHLSVAE